MMIDSLAPVVPRLIAGPNLVAAVRLAVVPILVVVVAFRLAAVVPILAVVEAYLHLA
jgi:hypothetical protein